MKRLATSALWVCMLLLLAGMTCRLFWLASLTETGLQTVKQQWRDATIGLVLGTYAPIPSRRPVDQAAFWLSEVDRVLGMDPDSSELAVGAAWVLDNPAPDFMSKYVKKIDQFPGVGLLPDTDRVGIKSAEDAFESLCQERCLELAAAATERDSTNVEWWRLRALLLWRYSLYSYDEPPRAPNWIENLDECARHDPDNALYDYLAAYFCWEASAEWDFSGTTERLVVKDAEQFSRGVRSFERGQAKPYFAVGDAGFTAVAEFLANAKLPITEHEKIVNSRGIHLRRSTLLRGVWQWQRLRAEEVATAGDVRSALAMHRENLRLIDQFTTTSASTAHNDMAIASRVLTTAQVSMLANRHEDLLSAEELREINKLDEDARLDSSVFRQAAQELAAANSRQTGGATLTGSADDIVLFIAVAVSASLAFVLLLVGLVASLLIRLFKGGERIRLGLVGHSFTFVTAWVVTIVVLGLAPARIIDREIQAWALTLLVILTPVALVSWIGWNWLRRRNFKFSLRGMFIAVTVLCVLFGILSLTGPVVESFATIPFGLAIPARGWEGLDANSLENLLRPLGDWFWAVMQWVIYYGHYLTVAVWAACVAMLLRIKERRQQRSDDAGPLSFRDRWGILFRSLSRPSFVMSALALLVYLVLAPLVVERIESNFQSQMAFARQPIEHWNKVDEAVQKVRSDDAIMERLRKAVRADTSSILRNNE